MLLKYTHILRVTKYLREYDLRGIRLTVANLEKLILNHIMFFCLNFLNDGHLANMSVGFTTKHFLSFYNESALCSFAA